MIKFNDDKHYMQNRINGVKRAYIIPFEGKANIAVDVGSNVGAFPLVNKYRFNRIICIEPSEYSYHQCLENVKDLSHVEVYRHAVSSHTGNMSKLKAYKESNLSGNASTIECDLWDNNNYELVETISFEDICKRYLIDKIDYMKVDCEGAEYDFLYGKDLSRVGYLGIEIHIQLQHKAKILLDFLREQFDTVHSLNDGIKMHFEITFRNKKYGEEGI